MEERKTDYERILARLDEQYPEREMLDIAEAARFYGVSDYRTAKKYIPFVKGNRVSKVALARIMSEGK